MDNIELLPNLRTIIVYDWGGGLADIKAVNQVKQLEMLRISSGKNSVIRLEDIPALTELKTLILSAGRVDVKGIEKLTSLDVVNFLDSDSINIEYLSGLQNLTELYITTGDTLPDMEFFANMNLLKFLRIDHREPYQLFDLTPLGNLTQLEYLDLGGFSLKNVSVLDGLEHLEKIYFIGSILNDKSEQSTKDLVFYYDVR
jgi:Leucine-rich repeat (LRR) protein